MDLGGENSSEMGLDNERNTPLLSGRDGHPDPVNGLEDGEFVYPEALRRLPSLTDSKHNSQWFNWSFAFIQKRKYWIVGVWTALLIWGMLTGFRYITEARDEAFAPKGSRADIDTKAFSERFAAQSTSAPLLIFVSCETCTVACPSEACAASKHCEGYNSDIAQFSHQLKDSILSYSEKHGIGYRNEALGYYFLDGTPKDKAKCQFVNKNGQATFLVFQGSNVVESKKRYDMIREINEVILPSLNPNSTLYKIGVTGSDPMLRDGSTAAVEQSEIIDAVTMPFAFALLGYMIRSWRLLLISLFNMGIALIVSFGVLAFLSDVINRPPMTTNASFVEVLGLAMNTDYALFMLRRLRDESKNGRSPEMAIRIMLSQAGHVVVMSSLTIICVFAGFLFMRSTELMLQGLACVTVVLMCLLVNMTNTPALLFIAPDFFLNFSFNENSGASKPANNPASQDADVGSCWSSLSRTLCGCFQNQERSQVAPEDYTPLPGTSVVAGAQAHSDSTNETSNGVHNHRPSHSSLALTEGGDMDEDEEAEPNKMRGGPYEGWYFRFILFVTEWPRNLIVLVSVYVLIIPLAVQALRLQRNCNIIQAIPRDSDAGYWYKQMLQSFSGGMVMPLYISVDGPQDHNNTLFDWRTGPVMFDHLAELTHELAQHTGVDESAFNSIAMAQGRRVYFSEAKILMHERGLVCKFLMHDFCELYEFAWKQGANELNTSALITVMVPFDPFEHGRMETFIRQVYEVIDKIEKPKQIEGIHLSGMQLNMIENMRISFDEFPLLVGITCAVVFCLLGVMLKSAFVIVRLTLTVVLPLAGVFGLSVLVYQDGILNFTGIPQLSSGQDGLFFYVPLLCFTICVGLALDYDTLCIARVKEHRERGLEIRAAILRGTWEISTTVVSAGSIMAIAFAGLLLATTLVVNQMSFILTTSVLFDSFIIQCCMMPCILSFADEIAWWPARMPQEHLVTLDEEIETRKLYFAKLKAAQAQQVQEQQHVEDLEVHSTRPGEQ